MTSKQILKHFEDEADYERQVDILARTLYGEARGEPPEGAEAVASVIMNRVLRGRRRRNGYWWGETVEEVCQKPWQFSCWNEDDPNRDKIEKVGPGNPIFDRCLWVARRAVDRKLKDRTFGATHYHAMGIDPHWAFGREACALIGHHLFYNDVE
ncbi:cell wall hydrolase [Magnetospira sp. QH-2]|uniref:cell wall hydrolase n=1 Tax=Magnetospira sp. (strain QH-2) TaxID=1288970 RepID=UPI0003E80E7B|nr:cell wall hydrolase [Magnetospira sp. QH-2]CCQ72302.1 Putative protein containing Cell Wall Hydrolase domain (selB) [Magnetospira sp. QH-2]